MEDTPRLIEHAFPLKQASLDSVHEKNVRHGHISTLHIWPARRPLAACRAALIATLLPDPSAQPKPDGMSDEEWHKEIIRQRQELCEKIGGKVVKKIERKRMPNGQVVEREKEETEGGILHWGRETENKELLEWFRKEIRKANGGRAPKVLDPFAGGGAIPLEAMRLGCEATAVDINPVAWFILKCTLEYPQKLAGKTWPLPGLILKDRDFMESFFKAQGLNKAQIRKGLEQIGHLDNAPNLPRLDLGDVRIDADLAWHVRAWGQWVLDRARRELARYYPTYADFEPLEKHPPKAYEKQPMQLVPLREDGRPDIDVLNVEFSEEYLADKRNPRWVAKPTVAYLWARTVKCKNCRATIPLLKTRWLCKKDNKRVLLTMEPVRIDAGTQGRGDAEVFVRFGIETNVPVKGGNAAQRREHDKRIGAGTMSRSGAKCPCCGTIMEMEDIRLEAQAGRFGYVSTATIVEGSKGKEHRAPTAHEIECAAVAENSLEQVFATVPFGLPLEHTPVGGGKGAGRAFSVRGYGLGSWRDLFTKRQLLALGVLVGCVRAAKAHLGKTGYKSEWEEAIVAYLACGVDRYVDFSNVNVQWKVDADTVNHALVRFAIQITWDFAEGNPIGFSAGSFGLCFNRIATGLDTLARLPRDLERPLIIHGSAQSRMANADLVITDPPYYDAIPYSDLMDWFYVWLRRMVFDLTADFGRSMASPLGPKWNSEEHDGELVDDETRHAGDVETSKRSYEEGMSQAFRRCADALSESGRFVIVFANKSPDAWETLVTSVIKAGFIAEGNWPIQTEQPSRMRGLASAALASSVWLVCKKRPDAARPGWDNQVLEEMRRNIREKLREFWDGGIRGPDFVWAATGPALEAYSKHLVVKKADDPGQVMTVSEFLTNVRRMVVDYVVGRVMYGQDDAETRRLGDAGTRGWGDAGTVAVSPGHRVTASVPESPIGELDEPTAYYLLHRHDFGMEEAPAGACILYAISCGISDRELASTWDLIAFTKGNPATEDTESTEDEDSVSSVDSVADPDAEEESGSKVKLKTWAQRKGSSLGYEAPSGKPVPLIDRAHRLMHLWKAGDLHKVDEYLDDNGLRRQELFKRLLQSLIELSPHGSEERSLLESISNHVQAKGAVDDRQLAMPKNE